MYTTLTVRLDSASRLLLQLHFQQAIGNVTAAAQCYSKKRNAMPHFEALHSAESTTKELHQTVIREPWYTKHSAPGKQRRKRDRLVDRTTGLHRSWPKRTGVPNTNHKPCAWAAVACFRAPLGFSIFRSVKSEWCKL